MDEKKHLRASILTACAAALLLLFGQGCATGGPGLGGGGREAVRETRPPVLERRQRYDFAAAPFDQNFNSQLLYEDGYLYQYRRGSLFRLREDTMEAELLYASDTDADSGGGDFFLYGGKIYFAELDGDGNYKLKQMGRDGSGCEELLSLGSEEDTRLKYFYIYKDIIYLYYYRTGSPDVVCSCYRLGDGGAEKTAKSGTLYGLVPEGYKELSAQDLILPYCADHYGYFFLYDETGALCFVDPESGAVKKTALPEGASVRFVTNDRILLSTGEMQDGYDDYMLELGQGRLKPWANENGAPSLGSCYDAEGVYCVRYDTSEGKTFVKHFRLNWDGTATEDLAETQQYPQEGLDYRSGWYLNGRYYFQKEIAYDCYLARAEDGGGFTPASLPYYESGISRLGSIEEYYKAWGGEQGETGGECFLRRLVYAGDSPAARKINGVLSGLEEEMKRQAEEDMPSLAAEDTAGGAPNKYEMDMGNITYVDERYFCLMITYYWYTGGVHGMPGRECIVFDRADGTALGLTDLTQIGEEELGGMILKAFEEENHRLNDVWLYDGALEYIGQNAGYGTSFYMAQDGLHFYFYPYEVAPAFPEVVLPFEKLRMKIEIGTGYGKEGEEDERTARDTLLP